MTGFPFKISNTISSCVRRLPRRVRVQPRFYGFLIAAACLFFCVSCGVSWLRSAQLEEQAQRLANQKQELEEQLHRLQRQLEYAGTDAYVEQIAREELNMLYPDEIRYVVN